MKTQKNLRYNNKQENVILYFINILHILILHYT